MDVRYLSSKRREPVREVRKGLYASLETAIRQASGFSLLANDNSQKIHVIMPVDRKQRRVHLALIFESTLQRLIACVSSCFFSQLFCLM